VLSRFANHHDASATVVIQSQVILFRSFFQALTQGMIDVHRMSPNDPIDHLAEYLMSCALTAASGAAESQTQ
jgi:hypothetical protein